MLENTNVQEINDAILILKDLNADEHMRYISEMREKALHDEATALGAAEEKGIEIGMKKGFVKGREEGREEGRFETLTALVKDGILTLADAAKRANMTISEFEEKTGLKA